MRSISSSNGTICLLTLGIDTLVESIPAEGDRSKPIQLSFGDHQYTVMIIEGEEVQVTRESKEGQCYPCFRHILSAISDFFTRWHQTGSFCRALNTRAALLKEGIQTLISETPLEQTSQVHFYADNTFSVEFSAQVNDLSKTREKPQ